MGWVCGTYGWSAASKNGDVGCGAARRLEVRRPYLRWNDWVERDFGRADGDGDRISVFFLTDCYLP